MKRIERNTYNSLRKSITADTINVEIPVEYTHEGRQGIHEMLTVEKHMRASMICWNSIINGYVIHYVPTVDEYTEAQRMEQESQDIDEVMNTLPKSDRTWNGYEKPAEETEETETETAAPSAPSANEETAAEEQTADTEEEEEEQTMKNTKSMTKSEAIREIATLSSSTLARICGSTNYSIIDDCSSKLILAASSMAENAFEGCENWMDVLDRLAVSKDNDLDNYYLLGNMDYREYVIKYGYDKAVTILNDYIEIILEGSAETNGERDYIRGAKDALCIA